MRVLIIRRVLRVLAAFTLSTIGSALLAQESGSIRGVVTDSTGAPLGSTSVVVKNLETGSARTIAADNGGRYTAPALASANTK